MVICKVHKAPRNNDHKPSQRETPPQEVPVATSTRISADLVNRPLLEWYDRHARDLPWRMTRDPYSILVSEIMLQQTQVDRVIPAYSRFLMAFPTIQNLAAATPMAVIQAWSGLGYYRRAVRLHRLAQIITDEMIDRFCVLGSPQNCIDKLRELEKIGVSRFCVYLVGLESQDEIRDQIALWGEKIIPEFR